MTARYAHVDERAMHYRSYHAFIGTLARHLSGAARRRAAHYIFSTREIMISMAWQAYARHDTSEGARTRDVTVYIFRE